MTEYDPIPPIAGAQSASDPTAQSGTETPPDPDPPPVSGEPATEIPVEDASPMIDIHPPHHGGITRRDFFIHLFTVILGILIAISLEQTVEYLHHRHLASEARDALMEERAADEKANELNIFATQRHEQDLKHDLAMLQALQTHQPLPPGPFIVKHVASLYADEEWQKIHQSGTVNYLTGNLGPTTYRYQVQSRFTDLREHSTADLFRAASVLRSFNDPPRVSLEENVAFSNFFRRLEDAHENLPQQEVDAAWATQAEPGNLAALSPAQIDSLERAIQIALADDDAMLEACFSIKRNLVRNPVQ